MQSKSPQPTCHQPRWRCSTPPWMSSSPSWMSTNPLRCGASIIICCALPNVDEITAGMGTQRGLRRSKDIVRKVVGTHEHHETSPLSLAVLDGMLRTCLSKSKRTMMGRSKSGSLVWWIGTLRVLSTMDGRRRSWLPPFPFVVYR